MSLKATELFSVQGKTALVTGGSRGIGFMIAKGLLQNGARLYIAARRADVCEKAAAELRQWGECTPLVADLASDDHVAALAADIARRESRLHILVNSPGTSVFAPLGSFPASGWDTVMALNVKAPFMLTQALLPQLKAAASAEDPARVVNISSIGAFAVGAFDVFSYGPSKAALNHVSRMLANRLAASRVTVNVIAPGMVPTDLLEPVLQAQGEAQLAQAIPLGRLAREEDMAGAALYLCSRAGAWVTGTVITVDGGASAR